MKRYWTYMLLLPVFWAQAWSVQKSADATAAFAAAELEHYLRTAVAGEILLGGEAAEFLVGIAPENAPPLHREGQWRIAAAGSKIHLYGGGARGSLYAVYRFLEGQCGVRWWSPWAESVPHHDDLTLENVDTEGEPYFEMRDIYRRNDGEWQDAADTWGIRNRLNSSTVTDDGTRLEGSCTFGRPYSVHTFDHYLNAGQNLEEHPEYFSEVEGKRIGGQYAGQLCLTNPEVRRIVREKLHEFIRLDRAEALAANTTPPRIYDISINDNGGYCRCAVCNAALAGGNQTDLLLDFINVMADSVREKYPDVAVSTLAYLYTEAIPVRTMPHDNVVIRLCDTATNPAFGLDAPENRSFARKLEAWSQLAERLSIWDYGVVYVRPGLPYPSEYVLSETMRQYADRKVRMMFWEHEFADCADMWEMLVWLEARLMDEPYLDMEALRQEFLSGYYGAAAADIAIYRQALREAAIAAHPYLHWYAAPALFDHLTLKNLVAFSGMLDAAAAKVADDPELAARVGRVRLSVDRAILLRWGILAREHFAAGGAEADFPFDRQALKARIRDSWEKALAPFSETGKAAARKRMAEELECYGTMPLSRSRVADTPPFGPNAVILSADTFNIFNPDLKFAADPEAYGGVAVAAVVPGAFHAGVYAVVDNQELLAPQEIGGTPETDGSYRWYRLGDVPLRHISIVYTFGWLLQVPLDRVTSRLAVAPEPADAVATIWLRAKFQNRAEGRIPLLDSVAIDLETRKP